METLSKVGIDLNSVVIYLINIGFLFLVIGYLVTGPLLRMLDKRNELSHTYNETSARKALEIIKDEYYPCIHQLYLYLKKEL